MQRRAIHQAGISRFCRINPLKTHPFVLFYLSFLAADGLSSFGAEVLETEKTRQITAGNEEHSTDNPRSEKLVGRLT